MDTDTAWQLWGENDPYYGVLTNPKYRSSVLTPQAVDDFFRSGEAHVASVIQNCRRYFDAAFQPRRVLDFGCGVGRTTIPFASVAQEVLGLDVAPAMLAEAGRNCLARGVNNVKLELSNDTLSGAEGLFDLVHSSIVLQHIEVRRGLQLFATLVSKIRSGGIGAIHLTFGWDFYSETNGRPPPPLPVLRRPSAGSLPWWKGIILDWWQISGLGQRESPIGQSVESATEAENADPEMQMHYYDLSEVMFLLQRAGVQNIFAEFTDHGGAMGSFLYFRVP